MTPTSDHLLCGIKSFGILLSIPLASDVAPTLWPRVWAWSQFIYAYHKDLTGIFSYSQKTFCIDFLALCGWFHDHVQIREEMAATPGFRELFSYTWTYLPQLADHHNPRLMELLLHDLNAFIMDSDPSEPVNLAELTQGAGGSISHLAHLVMEYFDCMFRLPFSVIDKSIVYYSLNLLVFINHADGYSRSEKRWFEVPIGPFCLALLNQGFLKILILMIESLCRDSVSNSSATSLTSCFTLLLRLLRAPGSQWLPEALGNGLLQAVVKCSTTAMNYTISDRQALNLRLKIMLVHCISANLIYYPTVFAVKNVLADVEEVAATGRFRQSDLSLLWDEFTALARSRVAVLKEMTEMKMMKACDNQDVRYLTHIDIMPNHS